MRGNTIQLRVQQTWGDTRVRSLVLEGLRAAGLHGPLPKIEFVPHHLSHAYSAYFCSEFDRAGILTIDGSGEEVSTQLAVAKGDDVRIVEFYPIPHSLGWFYAAVTQYLGFIPYRDEGKLMGLAALGEVRKDRNLWLETLSRILKLKKDSYEVDPTYTRFGGHFWGDSFTDEMERLITSVNPDAVPVAYGERTEIRGEVRDKYLLETYVDIAWAAQELLEQAAVMLAKWLVRIHGVENLCVAGGAP